MPIYCGNNSKNRRLISGELDIGKRSECLKKGVGVGLNQPIDPDYLDDYEPLYIDNFFCGDDEDDVPNNYRMGTLAQCLQKGVAVGKLQKAQTDNDSGDLNENDTEYNFILKFTLILFIDIIYLLFILYFKPKFFRVKDTNNLNTRKIILFFFLITLILYFLFFILFKNQLTRL